MLKIFIEQKISNTKYESNKSLFAREAKVNRDEIVRILSGKIKNPGVYTVSKIATVLNCSIDELLGKRSPSKQLLYANQNIFENTLFINSINYIFDYIRDNKLTNVQTGKIFLVLDAIYNFCYINDLPCPDNKFSKWFCENYLK